MRRQKVIRALLFAFFFGIGLATVAVTLLSGQLFQHYQNIHLKAKSEDLTTRLKSLNADYGALLEQLEKDPNLIERIAPATLGTEPTGANTVYPRAKAKRLIASGRAIAEEKPSDSVSPETPKWLIRCNEPSKRTVLFLAGAVLILISFICFDSPKEPPPKTTDHPDGRQAPT